ncbi:MULTISPECIES: agmatinase [unclassified Mesorhizobium]|uniref:agmatinase n=1 Tax=unclassified Mesorhizobium TaxID=325217 RepID=UPI000FCA27ED|nr:MULTISPECIES: agmatinase [unclassified Mesorhizobium]RUX87436.1 agmatinase [Mesorhizobium sp. M7D.F.Ca.US.004.01.2.1]RVA24308.1 agmatinase [Mesorhizobium sp. M7D.F.Ca.US.004.03.1.1]
MTDSLAQVDVTVVPRFANIATFMRSAHIPVSQGLDIAISGVPFDLGTAFRIGSRFGPSCVREQSRHVRRIHQTFGFSPFDLCKVADVGDAPVRSFSIGDSLSLIEAHFRKIKDLDIVPLTIGGDHTISLPILRGIVRDAPVGLIHIDAHSDTLDAIQGERYCNGTPFRRAVEEGLIDPKRFVQVGIRETLFDTDDHDWAKAAGIRMISMKEIDERGPADAVREIRSIISEEPAYLTLDIDSLDPSYAPGTGAVEPGGFTVREVETLLEGLMGVDLIGADLPEVSPLYDEGGRTGRVAATLAFDMLCLLAKARSRRKL